jgi:hypothetical protein
MSVQIYFETVGYRDVASDSLTATFVNPSIRNYASIPATYNMTVNSSTQITVHTGSLTFNGQEYSWPETIFQLGTTDHPLHPDNPDNPNGNHGNQTSPYMDNEKYYALDNTYRLMTFYNDEFGGAVDTNGNPIPLLVQISQITTDIAALDPRTPDDIANNINSWTVGFGEGPFVVNPATGSGSGDPFITPIF